VDKSGENFMLIGEYKHKIDSKKRLAIPSKFRKELTTPVVITRGIDNCLFVYSKEEWLKIISKLEKLSLNQANARSFSRMILSGAVEADIDSLGRIMIPDFLKDYAELKSNVYIIGLYNRLEIWNVDNWDSYKEKLEKKLPEISEQIQGF